MAKVEDEGNLHAGHRQRILKRLVNDGFENFAEHEVLEVYLFGVIRRGNTNITAHRLIKKFGSLLGVFQAPYEELITIEGVGPRAAEYIKAYLPLMGELVQQQYTEEKVININAFFTLLDLYITKIKDPHVYMLLQDENQHFIKFAPLADVYLNDSDSTLRYLQGYSKKMKYCTFVVRDKEKLTEQYLNDMRKLFDSEELCLKNAYYKTDFGFQSYFNPDEQYRLYIPALDLNKSIDIQKYLSKKN